jgi:hypothetical protein
MGISVRISKMRVSVKRELENIVVFAVGMERTGDTTQQKTAGGRLMYTTLLDLQCLPAL